MELQVFYQKRSCNYVRGILCGLPEKVTGRQILRQCLSGKKNRKVHRKTQEKIPQKMIGKVKEEDTAKKKDDAVPDTEDRPEKLYVHVCGNVNQPGVYELQQDSRVFEADEAAGGYDYNCRFFLSESG